MAQVKIEFNTSEFRFSHGREPKGRGSWAFEFPWSKEPWFTRGGTTFTEAKRMAREHVVEHFRQVWTEWSTGKVGGEAPVFPTHMTVKVSP